MNNIQMLINWAKDEKQKALLGCVKYGEAQETYEAGRSLGRCLAFCDIIEKLNLLLINNTREQAQESPISQTRM